MKKKVSIIVPSYKRSREMFERAISSLFAQTYENIEIVVVDDNAKAEHIEYRKALADYIAELSSDKIVYVQNSENLGGAESRNVGVRVASGEYITFLDDDDRYLSHKVERQLDFMLEHDLDMSFTNIVICDGDDKVVDYREYSKIESFDNDYLLRYHLTRQITATNTFMYKKSALERIGGFVKVPMGQEWYLMYNTIVGGLKIGYADYNDTILYRQGQECISNGANKRSGEKNLYAFKKSHFDSLTLRERMYVRFRHRAVMVIIDLRQKKYFGAMGQAFMAGLCSPIDLIKESISFFDKRTNVKLEDKRE